MSDCVFISTLYLFLTYSAVFYHRVYFLVKKLYPVLTALYFWTFLIIVYFVIFNVALAIILDAYAEVNEESRAYRAKKQLKKRNKDK